MLTTRPKLRENGCTVVVFAPGCFGLGLVVGEGQAGMEMLEMVRSALKALGSASPAELSRFVEQQYGVRIEPKFIPLYRASIRDQERLEAARKAATVAVEQAKAEQPAA